LSKTNVRLVGYTQPSEEFVEDFSDVKELIIFCARVSNPSNQFNMETADKLLKFLMRHKHWSPFEMANATVEIETTRDIARQILRHRSFSFQEFSQRYSEPTNSFPFVYREARLQDPKNKQNSLYVEDAELSQWWKNVQTDIMTMVHQYYNEALDRGIAKEQARAILPEGLTKSRLYMQGTIRSFIHYIELRTYEGTQDEHIEVAKEVANAIYQIFPYVLKED